MTEAYRAASGLTRRSFLKSTGAVAAAAAAGSAGLLTTSGVAQAVA